MKQINREDIQIARDERARIASIAAENAAKLEIDEFTWRKMRNDGVPLIMDILYSVAPEMPSPPPERIPAHLRPLGQLHNDALLFAMRNARRLRDAEMLRTIVEECRHRRTRRAARLQARARLALLAIKRPEALPFAVA